MAVKKIQIIPPGYVDVLHPETDSTVVLMVDGSTLENKMGTKSDLTLTGLLSNLTTINKVTLVNAINENVTTLASMTNTASMGVNGWFKDKKTGLIIQWGVTAQVSGQRTIILPIAFPNNAFVPIATCQYGSTIGYVAAGATKTSVILYPNDAGVNPISWFVIGN